MTMWVHVLRDAFQTLDEKRSAMFEGTAGILVHDRWGSCFLIPDAVHALCNSHIMQDLLAVEIEDGEPWARKMWRLLLQVRLATWLARKKKKGTLPDKFLAMFERIASGSWKRRSSAIRAWSRSGLRGMVSRVERIGGPDSIRPRTCREEGRIPPLRA